MSVAASYYAGKSQMDAIKYRFHEHTLSVDVPAGAHLVAQGDICDDCCAFRRPVLETKWATRCMDCSSFY